MSNINSNSIFFRLGDCQFVINVIFINNNKIIKVNVVTHGSVEMKEIICPRKKISSTNGCLV